ncbi:MAG: carbohydrate-binding domain-containing protein [Clostridia bacterium]|nr:carbohydrate-binding domain-containing protein [Clostridia bacterium]
MKNLTQNRILAVLVRALVLSVTVCLITGAAGCRINTALPRGGIEDGEAIIEDPEVLPAEIDTEIKPRDADPGYDSESAAVIVLSGRGIAAEGEGISVEGGTVTVTAGGTYIVRGDLAGGGVVVKASKEADVKLVLDGVNIENDGFAALYVFSANNVIVTLAEGSENRLATKGDFVQIDENNVNACVYSKDDIAFNGGGRLVVSCDSGHGIAAKDDLTVSGTGIEITAGNHGINVNDSIKIDGASITVKSGKDALHCENTEDISLGNIYISKGSFSFVTAGDGIDASGIVRIDDGAFDIESGNYRDPEQSADFGEIGFGRMESGRTGPGGAVSGSETNTASTKGIKADKEVDILGGSFRLVCEDDAVHSNGRILIQGGSFDISTGDDGIHADSEVMIHTPEGCDIRINNSYEGIEGASITVNAGPGTVSVKAVDDGFNASNGQGNEFGGPGPGGMGYGGRGSGGRGNRGQQTAPGQESEGGGTNGAPGQESPVSLRFLSGKVFVDCFGDGLDSNGTLEVKGGTIFVSGPTSSNNGAVDYNRKGVITGGTVIACGASQMAQNFGSESTQGSILVNCGTVKGGTEVRLLSGSTVLASFTPAKQFGSILVSSPELKAGGTYTVTAGSFSSEIKLDSLIYNSNGRGTNPGRNPGKIDPGGNPGSDPGENPGSDPGGSGEDPGGDDPNGDNPDGMGSGEVAPGDFGQLNPGR